MDAFAPLIVCAEWEADYSDLDRLAAQAVADCRNEIILEMACGRASVDDVFENLAATGLDPIQYAAASAESIRQTICKQAWIDPYTIPDLINELD